LCGWVLLPMLSWMKIATASHQFGEVIVENAFPDEHLSLLDSLNSVDVPLRPLAEFRTRGRPLEPKRHMRSIGGLSKPFLLPVDQAALNKAIQSHLRSSGWSTEPIAAGSLTGKDAPRGLKGDFVRGKVFVEVEFGNVASMHRDFFKFQIANRAGAGEVAVLIVATQRFAKFFDSGIATYEAALRHLPYLAIGIQMPIWFVGIEPSDFVAIGQRYEEMRALCASNGLECHPFDVAMGATIEVEVEALGTEAERAELLANDLESPAADH